MLGDSKESEWKKLGTMEHWNRNRKEKMMIKKEKTSDSVDTDDNLFDLIDSMYQDQE